MFLWREKQSPHERTDIAAARVEWAGTATRARDAPWAPEATAPL